MSPRTGQRLRETAHELAGALAALGISAAALIAMGRQIAAVAVLAAALVVTWDVSRIWERP